MSFCKKLDKRISLSFRNANHEWRQILTIITWVLSVRTTFIYACWCMTLMLIVFCEMLFVVKLSALKKWVISEVSWMTHNISWEHNIHVLLKAYCSLFYSLNNSFISDCKRKKQRFWNHFHTEIKSTELDVIFLFLQFTFCKHFLHFSSLDLVLHFQSITCR